MTISISEVEDRGELSALEPEWRRFIAELPSARPFGTPAWITSWLDAFWQDRPIRFLFARADGRLVGVAPLLVDDRGTYCCQGALSLPINSISWSGEILHRDDGGDVIEAMLNHLGNGEPVRLTLPRVAANSATALTLLSMVKKKELWGIVREENSTPIISLPSCVEEYLQSRSKHVRHELRRKRRRLEEAGRVTVSVVDQSDDLNSAFEDVRVIESRSWKGAASSSFLEAPFAEQFYRTLFLRTAAERWARIYVMRFDGKPVAHLFGFVFARRYYALNTSFDASLGSYSPGSVLVLHAIEDACTQGLEVFDFMGSEYRWKNEMATDVREHLSMCVFSNFTPHCGTNWVVDQHVKPYVRRHLPTLLRVRRAMSTSGLRSEARLNDGPGPRSP